MTSPVRVGVNLVWLVPGVVGGSEEYTTRLLQGLAERAPSDLHVTLFVLEPFARAHPELVAAFPTVSCRLDGRSKPRRVGAEATWLGRAARERGIDLLHHAGGAIPPGPITGRIPSVLTIHDLQPLLMPENFSTVKRRWLTTMVPRSARRARLILTPSDPVSASITEHLGVPEGRVRTVPHGMAPPPEVPPDLVARARERYRLPGRVILYPAIPYVHKGHLTLVAAMARLARDRPDLALLLTGGAGPLDPQIAAAVRDAGIGAQVRRTGRVPWTDLDALYAAASVVAVPSEFEGFGNPALEAMARGIPLVAADATALPWVVGDAGVLVPPGDPGAWADALAGILDDPDHAAALGEAGRSRAAGFTWERATDALVAAYRDAAAMGETGSP